MNDSSGVEAVSPFMGLPSDPEDLHTICRVKRSAAPVALEELSRRLARTSVAETEKQVKLRMLVGLAHSYAGELGSAIETFAAAQALVRVQANDSQGLRRTLMETLGISHLRQGELDNCVHNTTADRCLFPLRPGGYHQVKRGALQAAEIFGAYLKEWPDDPEVRWLLNVSYMTLGRYPRDVPEEFVISPQAFESPVDVGRFVDVAPGLGLGRIDNAGGTILDDFDGDGLFDVVLSSYDGCEPLRLFRNNGDGTFTDRTEAAGLLDQLGGINVGQTDYDNDGRLDIFVMRGGWEFAMRNSLLRNNGDGTFTDVTAPARIGFTAYTKGVAWGDYDRNGFPDLYVSNFAGENYLFRNDGNGTFTEVGKELGVSLPAMSFPTWFWDYDNDGWLDIFVASYVLSVEDVLGFYLGRPPKAETMKLYRNLEGREFRDVTAETGLNRVVPTMGANFGDIDNDGWLDMYLGTGTPAYTALIPNYLFKNDGGRRFLDVTTSSGTGHLQKGHGVGFADLDQDGDEDIFANMGGAVPGDKYEDVLFRNPGHGNHWIALRLVGVKSNRAAIGAKITVVLKDGKRYREVGSGGSFGASPLMQHIGLGKADRIERLEIEWPVSRTRQVFHGVPADRVLGIKELETLYRTLPRKPFALGRAR